MPKLNSVHSVATAVSVGVKLKRKAQEEHSKGIRMKDFARRAQEAQDADALQDKVSVAGSTRRRTSSCGLALELDRSQSSRRSSAAPPSELISPVVFKVPTALPSYAPSGGLVAGSVGGVQGVLSGKKAGRVSDSSESGKRKAGTEDRVVTRKRAKAAV